MKPISKLDLIPIYSANQKDFSLDEIEENFALILDGDGWKHFKRNCVSVSVTKVTEAISLPVIPTKINFVAEKIPLGLIKQVTAWMKAVYDKTKGEAVGYLYYNQSTKEWDFIPPIQFSKLLSTKYEEAPRKECFLIVGTIHSHANISAFHSSVDHKDEEHWDGVHITIGYLDRMPDYACSIVANKCRVKVELHDIVTDLTAPNFPADWMDAVKRPQPAQSDPKAKAIWELYVTGQITEEMYMTRLDNLEAKPKKEKHRGRTPYHNNWPGRRW